VVLGASQRVEAEAAAALRELEDAAETAFGEGQPVRGWTQWKQAVRATSPELLVAIPHQEQTDTLFGPSSGLELGGQVEDTFDSDFVSSATAGPGPVVLLLGCHTGRAEDDLASFAARFRGYGAAVVISSLGKVIAKEAPTVSRALLDELAGAIQGASPTIGDALLKTRRALLAKSFLLPLMLIAHGDGDWEVN
jgi:hypothetical protein